MTPSLGISANLNAGPTATADPQAGETAQGITSESSVQISKADGLRGVLGLHEVKVGDNTQFMTKDVDNAPHFGAFAAEAKTRPDLKNSVIRANTDTLRHLVGKFA